MRTKALAIVLLLAVAVVAISGTSDTRLRRAMLPEPPGGERALERVLPEVRLEKVPFEEAVRRLGEAAQVDILVDWRALAPLRSMPVTIHVRGATLAQALTRLTQELGETVQVIGFAADGDAIRFGLRESLQGHVVVRAYDVRDLLPPDPPGPIGLATGTPQYPVDMRAQRFRDSEQTRAQDLMEFLRDRVQPGTWVQGGGTMGDVAYFTGRLVVTQTPENQRQVEDLLVALRSAVPPRPSPSPQHLVWNAQLREWISPNPEPAERALQKVLPEVRLEKASLDTAAEELSRLGGANIVVEWHNVGIVTHKPAPITLHLRNVTLRQALGAAVSVAGGESIKLILHDGVLRITHRFDDRGMFTRVYDLGDWPAPGTAADERPDASPPGASRARQIDLLVQDVYERVVYDSWQLHGGRGSVRAVADRLVVVQGLEGHEAVRRHLNALWAYPSGSQAATTSAARPATTAPSTPLD